ncbi:hypothetical protein CTAYLR_005262, partial [Chrysophaeum taylorii]
TGYKVVPLVNATLLALIAVLVASALRWSDSAVAVHLVAMGVIAVLLLATVNWFSHELRKASKAS